MHLPRLTLLLAVGLIALALADFDDDDSCAGPECDAEPLPAKGSSILQAKTKDGSKSISEVYEDDDLEQVPVRSKNIQKRKTVKTPAKPAVAKSLIQTGSSSPTVVQGKDMAEEGSVSKGDMMKILRGIKAAEESGKLVELEPELKGSNKPSAFKKAVAFMMGKQEGAPEDENVFLTQLGEHTEMAQENGVKEAEGSTQLLPLEAQKQIALMLREKSHLKLERGRRSYEGLESERGLQGSQGRRGPDSEKDIEKALKEVPKTNDPPPEVPTGKYERPLREGPSEIDEGQMKKTLARFSKEFKETWTADEFKDWKKKMKKLGKSLKSEDQLDAFREAVSTETEKRMSETQKRKGAERKEKDKKPMPPEVMFRQLKLGTLHAELVEDVKNLKQKLRSKKKAKRSKWAKKVKENMNKLKKRAKWLEKLLDKTEDETVEDELDD